MAALVPDSAIFSFTGAGLAAAATTTTGQPKGGSPPRLPHALSHRLPDGGAGMRDMSLSLGVPSTGVLVCPSCFSLLLCFYVQSAFMSRKYPFGL